MEKLRALLSLRAMLFYLWTGTTVSLLSAYRRPDLLAWLLVTVAVVVAWLAVGTRADHQRAATYWRNLYIQTNYPRAAGFPRLPQATGCAPCCYNAVKDSCNDPGCTCHLSGSRVRARVGAR